MSVPEENRKTLPNGKPAPAICSVCGAFVPCEHQPAPQSEAARLAPAPVAPTPRKAVSAASELDLTASVALPTEGENIESVRHSLQAPQLIKHMVEFSESLLKCYDSDGENFAQQFAPIKRRADFLCDRHACIQDSKGKGVLTADALAAHLREVEEWIRDADNFNSVLCGNKSSASSAVGAESPTA